MQLTSSFLSAPKELHKFLKCAVNDNFMYEIDGNVLSLAKTFYDGDLDMYFPSFVTKINIDELLNNDLSNIYVDNKYINRLTLDRCNEIKDILVRLQTYL